jgi:hypothetical protein
MEALQISNSTVLQATDDYGKPMLTGNRAKG